MAVLVLGLKFVAYRLTGSVALYSDALESIINVVASGAALLALWVAARPADEVAQIGASVGLSTYAAPSIEALPFSSASPIAQANTAAAVATSSCGCEAPSSSVKFERQPSSA